VGVFIGLEKYKNKYTKNRENNKPSHNLLFNDCSGSDRESHTSLFFLNYFLLVLLGLLCPCRVTGLPMTNPMVISLFLWLISVIQDLTLFSFLPSITNFIQSYLHQFFNDSHGLKASLKPLRRPFD